LLNGHGLPVMYSIMELLLFIIDAAARD
jgi:hypothetical protein